jgi:hypothetical protein
MPELNYGDLSNFLLLVANAGLLPYIQEMLNKYVKNTNLRLICSWLLALICGLGWSLLTSGGDLKTALVNSALIFTTATTVYYKIVKPAR